MDHNLDNIFHFYSKLILVVPVFVISVVLMSVFSNDKLLSSRQTNTVPVVIPTPTFSLSASLGIPSTQSLIDNVQKQGLLPTVTISPVITSVGKNMSAFDLDGPLYCNYKDKTATVVAKVKNKNVWAQMLEAGQTKYLIINGDCLYSWIQGEKNGSKMCGVSQYLSMYQLFSQMGMANSSSLSGMMANYGYSSSNTTSLLEKVMQTCVKQTVGDSSFTVPSGINFVLKEISLIKQ